MKPIGKINLANYDWVFGQDADEECCYCLTNAQVRAMIPQLEYLTWVTRWYSTEQTVEQDRIEALSDDLYRRLIMGCGEDKVTETRVNPTTGYVEVRVPGGDWQLSPNDPRIAHPSPIPPVTSGMTATKCDAAVNVEQYLRDVVVEAIEAKATAQNLTAFILVVAAVIMACFVSGQWYLIPIIIEPLASLYWGWEASRILLAMNSTTYEEFRCIVYCHIEDDGSFTDADYEAIVADIPLKITNADARKFVLEHVKVWKAKGLSLAAARGFREASDCSDCDCGGCDFTNWIIAIGTEVSRTANEAIIAAELVVEDGQYHVNFYSPSNGIYCCNVAHDGTASTICVKHPPYDRLTDDNLDCSYTPGDGVKVNRIAFVNETAFTVTITNGACV